MRPGLFYPHTVRQTCGVHVRSFLVEPTSKNRAESVHGKPYPSRARKEAVRVPHTKPHLRRSVQIPGLSHPRVLFWKGITPLQPKLEEKSSLVY